MYNIKTEEDKKDVKAMIEGLHDLGVGKFATISGTQGKQFGREIYSSMLKFKDLKKFLEVFPEVQRDVNSRNGARIKTYVLSGIDEEKALKFFSAITVTCKGHVFYDETASKIAIDVSKSKLSINDGQHRFLGISKAIDELQAQVNRTTDDVRRQILNDRLHRLKEMSMPLVIFNQIGEVEEKQLFHDLNNLAQRPSRSATIKLAQTDLYSRMAREVSEQNDFLKKYGVEMDKVSIQKSNENTVLLTTVYHCVKEILANEARINKGFLTLKDYARHKRTIDTTFYQLFEVLPKDINIKQKYIIDKSYTLKGICRFIAECRAKNIDERKIFKAIKDIDWTMNYKFWKLYGATQSPSGNMMFAGSGSAGVLGIKTALEDKLNK